jgi:hypothetical protein
MNIFKTHVGNKVAVGRVVAGATGFRQMHGWESYALHRWEERKFH